MKSKYLLIFIVALAIAISGCSCPTTLVSNNSSNTSQNQTTGVEDTNEGEFITGLASVDSVQALVMESFPVQVSVEATGYLPDGCTEISNVTTKKDGNKFYLEISTVRPRDALCTQALVPFTKSIPLDVYGLEKGVYTVDVNGQTTSFELSVDNILLDGS